MVTVDINFWAVLVAAIINMVVGSLWYSPAMFGGLWMKAVGFGEKDIKDAQKNMWSAYLITFVGALVTSYVLAHFVDFTGATTFLTGAQTGFWAWVGFIATTTLGGVVFEKKSEPWYLITNGFHLVTLVINGGLLAVWV